MAEEDFSRPYVGYRSAGRRPESQQDRVASANAPLSALRGYIAGTLGLPGDIEGLGRMLIPGVSNESYIPGSEYFRKVLPMQGLQNTPTGRAFTELGGLAGGAGLMTAGKAGKAGARYAGEQLNRAILDSSGPLAKMVPEAAKPMYAVKPKGGNWLSGSVENPLYTLKQQKYDSKIATSQEEADDLIAKGFVREESGGEGYYLPPNPVNKWLDTKLNKYIKNEMGTPDDPVRALAERGITHAEIQPTFYNPKNARREAGFPEEGMGVSPQAKAWENQSDTFINMLKASDMAPGLGNPKQILADPWLLKVPPETRVYELLNGSTSDLGFGHMTDELRNMLDSESGLPANLRLTPEQLDKVTVGQMVEKVNAVNKWRAAEAAKAEKAGMLDNLTATPRLQDPTTQLSFVEKPGMTWVDIPATTDEAAKKYCTTIGKQAGWCTQGDSLAKSYGSGTNRLTALLDADGRPHVQAMLSSVAKTDEIMDDIDDIMNYMSKVEQRKFNKFLGSDDFYGETDEALEWLQSNIPKAYERYVASLSGPSNIEELKPVGNAFSSDRANEYAKRDPEYKAKITDSVMKFLNNGEWGTVKDLDIYKIIDTQDDLAVKELIGENYGRYFTGNQKPPNSIQHDFIMNYGGQRFIKAEQFSDLINDYIPKPEGFAKGGSVSAYDPARIDEIINGIDAPQGYDEGGSVRASEDTLDTFVAPRYRKQRAKPSSKETKAAAAEAAQFAAEMLIPQTLMDAGLMLIPGGKIARKAGAALIALDAGNVEAGGLSALRKFKELINREAPEQANKIREALRLTNQTGREHSVIGLANEGGESVITRGTESAVLPNSFDLRTAKRAPGSPTIVDFHTHPGQGTIFETAPSRQDFQFYSSEYPSKAGRDLRTLVAVPPTKDGTRRTTSYNFFETQDPGKVFDPYTLDNARFELQRAGKKGSFKSIQDDPALRDYFDYGGDLASLLEDATPLALMRYRAGQGLGRHELQLGGAQLAPSPGATDIELFRQLERPAMELLKSKKFAEGGSVSVYDPNQIDAIVNQYM